ncbi:MAG: polysaccharide lyase family 7 protein [Planctomycetes bacterium]|nr:polysaccharide lyase family 7 protein [Planctomycetota bacterium]
MAIGLGTTDWAVAADVPAKILDLTHWKLTVPVAGPGSSVAQEIRHPELTAFVDPTTFFVDAKSKGVVFRAPCGGVTTKGSKFPRCELREVYGNAKKESEAVWATDDGVSHVMTATLAVTHLPDYKPHVVCAQIHDAKDDLMMVRLEGHKLFVERNLTGDVGLDSNYALGTFFDLKIEASDGHVKVWYNGTPKLDWEQPRHGCYFKAGCYTQSNVQKGDSPSAYGEVVIRKLALVHTPTSGK